MLLILFNMFLLLCDRTMPNFFFNNIFALGIVQVNTAFSFSKYRQYPNCTWKLIQKLFGVLVLELCIFSPLSR